MTNLCILDTNWMGRPHSIAAALLEFDSHCAIVDPGPESTLPAIREQLGARGLKVADVDAILVTHIHLDHSGATGALVRENPRLQVYVHSVGAPHMIDPTKLVASAARLWGPNLPKMFGNTLPVPKENLRILEGGEKIAVGNSDIDVEYTPGHAWHHVSYFDNSSGVAFVGDTGGIHIDNGPFILPATPPPDIDLEIWDKSFATILGRKPARLFLTHYGYSDDPAKDLAGFRERLHRWCALADRLLRTSASDEAAQAAFIAECRSEMDEKLGTFESEHHAFTGGLDLSFLGLARYLRKLENKAAEAKGQTG
jgi:glyoxylase-like metal-dependent hydrolase (beta-lactamase superfamily II)